MVSGAGAGACVDLGVCHDFLAKVVGDVPQLGRILGISVDDSVSECTGGGARAVSGPKARAGRVFSVANPFDYSASVQVEKYEDIGNTAKAEKIEERDLHDVGECSIQFGVECARTTLPRHAGGRKQQYLLGFFDGDILASDER